MRLSIISRDIVQSDVIAGAARRRGWTVACSDSIGAFHAASLDADALVVDLDDEDCPHLPGLVDTYNVFLLVDRASRLRDVNERCRGYVEKPFHPRDLLARVEASLDAMSGESMLPAQAPQ